MEHRRMAPDTKILEELRAVYKKRPPETDGLGNLPASVFDFAAASKLNTKALTSEALSEGMGCKRGGLPKLLYTGLAAGLQLPRLCWAPSGLWVDCRPLVWKMLA
jgi:hypothetical protein